MTQEEKTEIAGLISTSCNLKDAEHEANYKLIDFKLGMILEQTTLHNQRMGKAEGKIITLEKNEVGRESTCTQAEKVRALEDSALSTKSVKKWIIGSIVSTGGIMTIVWVLYLIFVNTPG